MSKELRDHKGAILELSRREKGSKIRRRRLCLNKDMGEKSTCGGVAGGKEVSRDFWPWRGSARAEREQLSPEQRERVSTGISEESAAGKDGVGEIDVALVLGRALGGIHGPGRGLGKIINRLLAKLSGTIKIANTSNQGEAESKALSAIAVPLREDTKPFHETNSVFNKDTFA